MIPIKASREILPNNKVEILSYGKDSVVGPFIDQKTAAPFKLSFKLKIENQLIDFQTKISGEQNALNLSACILFLYQSNFSLASIRKSIQDLRLVKQRQQIKGNYQNTLVIEDYAHHPTAVRFTLDQLKKDYAGKSLCVVFGPHSAMARTNIYTDQYIDVLSGANKVIVLNPQKENKLKKYKDLDLHQLSNGPRKKELFLLDS